MKSREKLIVLLGILIAIPCVIRMHKDEVEREKYLEERHVGIHRRVDLSYMISDGSQIQAVIDHYHKQTGRFPTVESLTNILFPGFFSSRPVSFEDPLKYKRKYSSNFSTNFDGTGGWFYDEANGRVGFNTREDWLFESSWVDLSKVRFRPEIEIPVRGSKNLNYTNFISDSSLRSFDPVAEEGVASYLKNGKVIWK